MHDPRTLGNSPPKRRFTSWKNSPVKHLQSSPPPSQNRSNTDHIEQAIIWKTSCSSSEPTVRHLPHPLILKIQHLRQQESRKKELAGTKVATNAGGIPKKAEKPKAQCQICRVELIATMPTVLRDHASNKHVKNTFEQCFPNLPV
ncbi:hypothetical protein PGTUg99_034928 [Puccinia graminis f. sp. tritici]|uniref:At2g23090-like zinc-binding domain-containing protein n=1 Tax=Puccinia graminis f. sp. tritici TaxID=56615 RepID=A0A5B0SLK3_PUCGR|nr:hypothetical protein PGTUg99_034928 [Puccinia graminis f. sp. tritici]